MGDDDGGGEEDSVLNEELMSPSWGQASCSPSSLQRWPWWARRLCILMETTFTGGVCLAFSDGFMQWGDEQKLRDRRVAVGEEADNNRHGRGEGDEGVKAVGYVRMRRFQDQAVLSRRSHSGFSRTSCGVAEESCRRAWALVS